jgi:hypothetical protein
MFSIVEPQLATKILKVDTSILGQLERPENPSIDSKAFLGTYRR